MPIPASPGVLLVRKAHCGTRTLCLQDHPLNNLPGLCNRFGQTAPPADPCADGGRGDHPDPRAPRRALRTRVGTFNRTSREQNAHLDEHRTAPPPAPRTAPPRRRPVARGGPGGGRGQRRTSPGARSCGWGSCRRRRGRAGSVRRPLMRMGSRRRRARRGALRPAARAVVA